MNESEVRVGDIINPGGWRVAAVGVAANGKKKFDVTCGDVSGVLYDTDLGPLGAFSVAPRATTKDTNPKDAAAALETRLPLHLVPASAIAFECLALYGGSLKYGKYNWRISGVRASVYLDAIRRHLAAWESGEECDAEGVPHLASIRASVGIIIDARECDRLTDDRPPRAPVAALQRRLQGVLRSIRDAVLADSKLARQYTIADGADV